VTAASSAAVTATAAACAWSWPVSTAQYDCSPTLSIAEQAALDALGWDVRCWPERWTDPDLPQWRTLQRLVLPLAEARECLNVVDDWFHRRSASDAVALLLQRCAVHGRSFWVWDAASWAGVLGTSGKAFLATYPRWADTSARSSAIALAYLFGFTELHMLGNVGRGAVARKVFGRAAVDRAVEEVTSVLHGWGQRSPQVTMRTASLVCHALLLNRSPSLADLSEKVLLGLRANMSIPYSLRQDVHSLHRALAALGHTSAPRPPARLVPPPVEGVAPTWADWVQRWHDTSALPASGRKGRRNQMLRMGRWLAAEHPEVQEPSQWTRELCAAWVAAVDRLRIGDYTQNDDSLQHRIGEPLMPRTKSGLLAGARQIFRDCQEWGWIVRRFDPIRAIPIPRKMLMQRKPSPRGNRSGCENLTLAIISPRGVPCRHGNTACIITRGVGADPTRSASLYSGTRSACGDCRRHDAGVARTAEPDLAELLTPPIKRPAPPRATPPSSEYPPSWWSTGPSWLYAHPDTCGRSR